MRWNASILNTDIKKLFIKDGEALPARHVLAMENIRETMLDCVDTYGGKGSQSLKDRIHCAKDVHDLWYLRGDLLAQIAGVAGEVKAREETALLSNMFKGLLPKGMASRPSPLSN